MTALKEEWKTLDNQSHEVQKKKKKRTQNLRAYTVKYNILPQSEYGKWKIAEVSHWCFKLDATLTSMVR